MGSLAARNREYTLRLRPLRLSSLRLHLPSPLFCILFSELTRIRRHCHLRRVLRYRHVYHVRLRWNQVSVLGHLPSPPMGRGEGGCLGVIK
jgi:hypothetical protein